MINLRPSRIVPLSAGIVMLCTAAATAQAVSNRLLATNKTSTMQKEMKEAAQAGYRFGGVMGGDTGFEYRGQTVFSSAFGGDEVVVILERNRTAPTQEYEYYLLATSKTSTMQKELQQAGEGGFEFVGMTVGRTGMGGKEVIVITRRARR